MAVRSPSASAGPSERAGCMEAPLIGPPTRAPSATVGGRKDGLGVSGALGYGRSVLVAVRISAGRTARSRETRSRMSQLTRRADHDSAAATYDAS